MADVPQIVDPSRCPLCGDSNTCGAESGSGTCWCFSVRVPQEVLDRIPEALRDRACVCERCASGRRSPVETQAIIDRLTRER